MRWIEPLYTKKKVQKAGNSLVTADVPSDEFQNAIPIFHNWRAAHAFPMQIMLDLLRKNALRIDKKAIAVQRLKRVKSIFQKLLREKKMSLSRMEDIAGCRVVVSKLEHVNEIVSLLRCSRTKNVLHRERDYITHPKKSGYRGVHLVFRYCGSKEKFNGMAVELQVRSKIQHSWATAVEVVGTYTKQALKASAGMSVWLDFFKYASVEFAKMEKSPIGEKYRDIDTFLEMDKCVKELNLFERLNAFRTVTTEITRDKQRGAAYFIVRLDIEQKIVKYTRYTKEQLNEATENYDEQEKITQDDANIDVVLVSAASVRDLKRAYPNYFADTDIFEGNLRKVYEANEHLQRTN